MAGSIAENRCTILGRVFPFDSGTTPLSSSKRPHTIGNGNVAASPRHAHWEGIERILRYLPDTPDLRFTHAEVSSPQKGHSNATAAWPWTGAPHWSTCPSPSRTTT